jgi:hypothetical protein
LISCCKYEDGPIFSLVSVPDRIAGYYEISYITENGIDIKSKIDSLNITSYYFSTAPDLHYFAYYCAVSISDTITYPSAWTLLEDDKKILVLPFGCGGYNPPASPPSFQPLPGFMSDSCQYPEPEWNITKLTTKKIWINTNYHDNNYEIHFKQIQSAQ